MLPIQTPEELFTLLSEFRTTRRELYLEQEYPPIELLGKIYSYYHQLIIPYIREEPTRYIEDLLTNWSIKKGFKANRNNQELVEIALRNLFQIEPYKPEVYEKKDFMTKIVQQDPFTQSSYSLALLYGIGVPDDTAKGLTEYFLVDPDYDISLLPSRFRKYIPEDPEISKLY